MKTLLALLAMTGVTAPVLAQGTVDFRNNVWESTISRRVTGINGAPLVGTDYVAQLYYGTTPCDLHPVTNEPARFRVATTTQPGTWEGGMRTLSGFGPGDTVWLQVLVWNRGAFPSWDAVLLAGGICWASCPFTYTVPSSASPPAEAFWMSNFSATVPLDRWGESGGFTFRRSGDSLVLCSARAQVWQISCRVLVRQMSSVTASGEFLTNMTPGGTLRIPMTNDMMFFRLDCCWHPP
jgi:hypothetical protein